MRNTYIHIYAYIYIYIYTYICIYTYIHIHEKVLKFIGFENYLKNKDAIRRERGMEQGDEAKQREETNTEQ